MEWLQVTQICFLVKTTGSNIALSTLTCAYKNAFEHKVLGGVALNTIPMALNIASLGTNNQVPTTVPSTQVRLSIWRMNEWNQTSFTHAESPILSFMAPITHCSHPFSAAMIVCSPLPDGVLLAVCPTLTAPWWCSPSVRSVPEGKNWGCRKRGARTTSGTQEARWYTNILYFESYTFVFMRGYMTPKVSWILILRTS